MAQGNCRRCVLRRSYINYLNNSLGLGWVRFSRWRGNV